MADSIGTATKKPTTQPGPFPNKFLAGVILFLIVGALMFFISGDKNGATIAAALIGSSILIIIFADAELIDAGQKRLFSILGVQS